MKYILISSYNFIITKGPVNHSCLTLRQYSLLKNVIKYLKTSEWVDITLCLCCNFITDVNEMFCYLSRWLYSVGFEIESHGMERLKYILTRMSEWYLTLRQHSLLNNVFEYLKTSEWVGITLCLCCISSQMCMKCFVIITLVYKVGFQIESHGMEGLKLILTRMSKWYFLLMLNLHVA